MRHLRLHIVDKLILNIDVNTPLSSKHQIQVTVSDKSSIDEI